MLASIPGTELKFDSIDTGNAKLLENSAAADLYLKRHKVMLLYNTNNHLKNATCGKFESVDESIDGGLIVVNFPKVGSVTLRRKT